MIERSRQRGFTLLEVVIALTVAGLAAALGARILAYGIDFQESSREYIRQQQQERSAVRLMRQESQGLTKEAGLVSWDDRAVEILTDRLPLGIGGLEKRKVRWLCREEDKGRMSLVHVLLPQTSNAPAAKDAPKKESAEGVPASDRLLDEPREDMLVSGLERCSFAYLMKTREKQAAWIEQSDQLARTGDEKPLAFGLKLVDRRGAVPMVVVPLP